MIINPEIVSSDAKTAKAEEGCLSIPDVYGDVERPATRAAFARWTSTARRSRSRPTICSRRCLQHEIDHLHGKLFIDYLSVLKRRSALTKWAKEKDKYPGFIRTARRTIRRATHEHPDEEL